MIEIFNYLTGEVVGVTGYRWIAWLLTAPHWYGPKWLSRLWVRTNLLDYASCDD